MALCQVELSALGRWGALVCVDMGEGPDWEWGQEVGGWVH